MGAEVSSTDVGAAGTMTCGCMKADDNDEGSNVRTHELHGAGDRHGRRVVRTWECMEMGKSGCV